MSIERDLKACKSHAEKHARKAATAKPPTFEQNRQPGPRPQRWHVSINPALPPLYPDYTVGPGIKPGLLTLSPMLRRQALAG